MEATGTEEFWDDFYGLPEEVRRSARSSYRQWKNDPHHPGLLFKEVIPKFDIWSARITQDYRAVGRKQGPNRMVWFVICTHNEQDKLLRRLQKISASQLPKTE